MRGLWLRLLRGGGRPMRLELLLPLVAGGVITFVLLVMLGLQQGLDQRADRTSWRTPEPATGTATAIQSGSTDYVKDRPIAVVELAALNDDPPALRGEGGFPARGEVWASPALVDLMEELPDEELADRFPGRVAGVLDEESLEHPEELVAVVGRAPRDPALTQDRAPHLWNEASSVTPTKIDGWSATPDLHHTVYRDIALLAVVLTALPLAGLGGLAARLMAGRRQRRLATLRLLGASTAQVARLTVVELATLTGAGALAGAVLHRLVLPLTSRVPIKGGPWFPADVRPDALVVIATVAGVVAVLTGGALIGILPAIRDPLGTFKRARAGSTRARWLSLPFIAAAVALFWLRSSSTFVSVSFTAVVVLGWGLLAAGPLLIRAIGALLAWRAGRAATLIAGRRLVDSPGGVWRAVSGFALAAFMAGFVAACLPVGLGTVGDSAAREDRLDAVVPAASSADTARDARTALEAADVDATVEPAAAPFWLPEDEWATLTVNPTGGAAELDRARTALIEDRLWGPEMRLTEDQPNTWLVMDGVVVGLLVLPVAALVALATMVIGAIARILDQRDAVLALRLAGTDADVLHLAQRHELVIPTAVAGGFATLAGLVSGSTVGSVSLVNPYTIAILAGLTGVGAAALWLADRATRPVLARAGSDLSARE